MLVDLSTLPANLESDFTLWRTGEGGAGEWTLAADPTAARRPRDRASEQGPHRLPASMAAINWPNVGRAYGGLRS
jgi:hypothetical protein